MTSLPFVFWCRVSSNVKFHEIFRRKIFHEIFREIYLKYFQNLTGAGGTVHYNKVSNK